MSGDTGRTLDWKQMVYKQLGTDRSKPEDAYRFSNGRVFKDTGTNGGPYTGTSTS